MDTITQGRSTFIGLVRGLTTDTRTFIRQEIQLAKTELSEKLSTMGKNVAALAVGGFVAYAGLIVLLIGLGYLAAWGFQQADLSPALSGFLGLAGVGLVVVVLGSVLLLKGLSALKAGSVSPERTLNRLQELKGDTQGTKPAQAARDAIAEADKQLSSADMESRVKQTENRMGETLDELGRRLSPSHINAQVKEKISANPYRSGLIAMAVGLMSGLFLRRKLQHA